MIYLYRSDCGKEIEISRSPNSQKIPAKISRKKIVYYRVFSVGAVIMDLSEPKTIGSLAEKNTAKMVKEGKLIPKEDKTPWWRKGKKLNKDLKKLNKNQAQRYIKTGKL